TLSPPDQPVAVAAGTTPGAVSVAVSRQLFDRSPAVVVAAATDAAGIADAAAQAERLGVPLLLDDGTGAAVRAEVDRLGPETVVAVGPEVAGRLRGAGPEVVSDAGEVSSAPAAAGLADVAVLVRRGTDAAGAATVAAVTATGRAAGATVVPVATADPRADPAAVEALAAAKAAHVLAAGSGFGAVDRLRRRLAVAATGTQLPGGGQVMFPGRRLVAMYGHPGSGALGVLGEQPVDAAIARAKKLAAPYRALSGRTPVVPTFEIISTVATAPPGPDGNYSFEAPVSLLKPWVDKAGKAGMYVVLDLQPGRTDFLTQAKRYESLLRLPHVGLALDPEWRLKPGQRHLTQIGSVSAAEVNSVYRWLADLTAKAALPQKVLVLHQFRLDMIGDDQPLQRDRDEVALLVHMDGQGPTGSKDTTWRAVVGAAPKGVALGWKNFYDEDSPMLTPAQTMTRKPTPLMISYQ
ncbi:MAG TPA: hypothetical protein VE547_03715, partial [Mycobacteriales bacterium]|nr:hypothetical protein [Mycobacteriales bacterium]